MALNSEQRSALRRVRSEAQEAVYLGIDPEVVEAAVQDEVELAAHDYAVDEGKRPDGRP